MSPISSIWFGIFLCAVIVSADVQSDVKDIVNQFPWDKKVIVEPVERSSAPIEELFKVPAVKNLVQYLEKHGINAEKLVSDFLKSINQYPVFAKATSIGDILDIILKNLSLPEVKAMIEKKKQTDPDFAKLAGAIRNPEFMVLFYRALNAKAVCAGCNGQQVRRIKISVGIGFSFGK